MAAPPRDCLCFSGLRYRECCAAFHSGEREAPTAEALMRSRYSAFAMGLGEYLVKTLAAEHPDLATDREALVRALSRFRSHQRFMGLTVLQATENGDTGQVLFFARIFERGENRSFAELSDFVREAGAWRYASGVLVPPEDLPEPSRSHGAGLTLDAFLEAARRRQGSAP